MSIGLSAMSPPGTLLGGLIAHSLGTHRCTVSGPSQLIAHRLWLQLLTARLFHRSPLTAALSFSLHSLKHALPGSAAKNSGAVLGATEPR